MVIAVANGEAGDASSKAVGRCLEITEDTGHQDGDTAAPLWLQGSNFPSTDI